MTEPIRYSLLDPTGNITILVETPIDKASQPLVAARLMELEPSAEQVGFLSSGTDCDIALRMAGGEFCGNAAMSAAALFAMQNGGTARRVFVRVSGAAAPVQVDVVPLPDGRWRGTVAMPSPTAVESTLFPDGQELPVVRFEGISHVILEQTPDPDSAEALAPVWCRFLDADGLGLMFLDPAQETLTPLVYVPAAGTLFWETSCASGTTAAGLYLARRYGWPFARSLHQPGGTLEVAVSEDGTPSLTGSVILRKQDEAVLETETKR